MAIRTTLVLLQVGLDVETSAACVSFVPGDEYLFGFLLLPSTLYFQLGSGSGLDVIKFPTCSNTCPLADIYENPRYHSINYRLNFLDFV
jgi:hypothetical protein